MHRRRPKVASAPPPASTTDNRAATLVIKSVMLAMVMSPVCSLLALAVRHYLPWFTTTRMAFEALIFAASAMIWYSLGMAIFLAVGIAVSSWEEARREREQDV